VAAGPVAAMMAVLLLLPAPATGTVAGFDASKLRIKARSGSSGSVRPPHAAATRQPCVAHRIVCWCTTILL